VPSSVTETSWPIWKAMLEGRMSLVSRLDCLQLKLRQGQEQQRECPAGERLTRLLAVHDD